MKIRYILIIAVFLFSMNVPIQAQSDEGGFLEGIQSSLSNMFDNSIQHTEAGRLYMLFTSDIRMLMKAHDEGINQEFLETRYVETSSDASIYAEFDWDNKALSMHLKKSENKTFIKHVADFGPVYHHKKNKEIDHYQYTDKDGYWYVPGDPPHYQGTGEQNYIKFNAKKAARDGLDLLSELNLGIIAHEVGLGLSAIWNVIGSELYYAGVGENYYLGPIDIRGFSEAGENAEARINEIRQMLNEEYLSMVGFPVFIHWALIYSPDVILANYNVTETTQDCYNIPNGCTKLTIGSGKDRGKYMIFDQYNRLIYIDSKKEGSVEFRYDRDLTVRLPPAWNYSDIMREAINSQLDDSRN